MSDAVSTPLRVLVVDDEPDVAAVTRLSLRGMDHNGRPVELVAAASGAEGVAALRADPDIAVVLLDVVMETDTAGLDACRAIREELGNRFVRICSAPASRASPPSGPPSTTTTSTATCPRPSWARTGSTPRSAPPSRPSRSSSTSTATAGPSCC